LVRDGELEITTKLKLTGAESMLPVIDQAPVVAS